MENYIKIEDEFNGTKVDKVFTTDVLEVNLFIMNTIETIKETDSGYIFSASIGGSIIGDPVIDKDVIYFGACDKNLYAVYLNGKEKWRFKANDVAGCPAVHADRVYFGSFDGNLYCLDLEGKLIWKYALNDKIVAPPVIYKDVIYFTAKDYHVYALDTKGNLKWKFKTGGPIGYEVTIFDDVIYIGSRDYKFYAINLDGTLRWDFVTGGILMNAHIDSSGIYFPSYDKKIYCLDHDGKLIWTRSQKERNVRGIVCDGNVLYHISMDGCLYAMKKDGTDLWKFITQSSIFGLPCFDKENVYIGSSDNNLYCVDKKTGKEKWRCSCKGPLTTSMVMKDNLVFTGGWDCNIYAINIDGNILWTFQTSLSYMSTVEPEVTEGEVKTFQVVWDETIKPEKQEKYKEKMEEFFGGYGSFSTSYVQSSDYTGRKKKDRYA